MKRWKVHSRLPVERATEAERQVLATRRAEVAMRIAQVDHATLDAVLRLLDSR